MEQHAGKFYKPFRKTLDTALETTRPASEERLLGTDPATGKPVLVRFGGTAPWPSWETAKTPKTFCRSAQRTTAGIRHTGRSPATVSLTPELGLYKDAPLVVASGRYGPYVKWQGKNVSLDKSDDPYTVSLERGIQLIEQAVAQEE